MSEGNIKRIISATVILLGCVVAYVSKLDLMTYMSGIVVGVLYTKVSDL